MAYRKRRGRSRFKRGRRRHRGRRVRYARPNAVGDRL